MTWRARRVTPCRDAIADEPTAEPDGHGPGRDEGSGRLRRDAAGRDERDIRECPRHSRTNDGPSAEAGKSFTAAAPARQAVRISVGVAAPGNVGMPRSAAQRISSGSVVGITRNVAGVHRQLCVLDAQHRAGADRDARVRAGDGLDRPERDRLRFVEGDLEGADPAVD